MAFDPRTKEERKLFPFWTLIVIAGCVALWVFGAKIYQESMAAYQSYAAITQNVAQNTYYPGVTVDGVELGGMTRVRGFTQDDAHIFCTASRKRAAHFRWSFRRASANGALPPTRCR